MPKNFEYVDSENEELLLNCLHKSITSFKNNEKTKAIIAYAFKDCKNLEKVVLDGNIQIESFAFPEPSIKELTIGNIDSLGNSFNVKNLKKITILKNAQEVYPNIFFNVQKNIAPKLEEIVIEEDNEFLQDGHIEDFSNDGIWYQKNCATGFSTIIFYPPGKRGEIFKVPSFVKSVDGNTFHFNPFLKKIIFPKDFNGEINEKAFDNCPNLETIIFQDNTCIDEDAITNCPNLKYIVSNIKTPYMIEDIEVVPFSTYIFENAHSFKDINNFYKNTQEEER